MMFSDLFYFIKINYYDRETRRLVKQTALQKGKMCKHWVTDSIFIFVIHINTDSLSAESCFRWHSSTY